jgi:hypothetical protein
VGGGSALSLLPSIFGTGVSVILIEYNKPLSFLGLAIIFGFRITTYKLRQEQKTLKFIFISQLFL